MPKDSGLQQFVDDLVALGKRDESGRIAFDLGDVQAAVRGRPGAAREFVLLACERMQVIPGYVQQAALVALAYKHEVGDESLLDEVSRAAEQADAMTELNRIAVSGWPGAGEELPERAAARAMWRDDDRESALCDGCDRRVERGAGYLVSGIQFSLAEGELTIPAGDMLLCEECRARVRAGTMAW